MEASRRGTVEVSTSWCVLLIMLLKSSALMFFAREVVVLRDSYRICLAHTIYGMPVLLLKEFHTLSNMSEFVVRPRTPPTSRQKQGTRQYVNGNRKISQTSHPQTHLPRQPSRLPIYIYVLLSPLSRKKTKLLACR